MGVGSLSTQRKEAALNGYGLAKKVLLKRLRHENHLNPGGRGYSELRLSHCTPWATTGFHHVDQADLEHLTSETGFHQVGQAGLKLLTSSDPPKSSASQSAGITGVSHRARPTN
ncbi:hypothetical protein AAY473_021249 [Plecturocebus cupreus]